MNYFNKINKFELCLGTIGLIIVIILIYKSFFQKKMEHLTTTEATTGYSNEAVQNVTSLQTKGYYISPGMILLWSGDITKIPTGYTLCNGQNGAPDLRNMFIVGAGDRYTQSSSGGNANNKVTLTTAQLPAHNHNGTTDSGSLTNSGTCARNTDNGSSWYVGNAHKNNKCPNTNHTHTFTTQNTGNGNPIDITPQYYALAYIMKISN